MSDTIIRVENLSKKYILSHRQEGRSRYVALRDVISNKANFFFNNRQQNLEAKEEFWALKDLSFEIRKGETVGIIGRNGAGKSTLLKILSRITEPTTGKIALEGRVASLLEVGTGFHPELTGRENIFLNGAILGMSKIEIQKKFDEIVDFAEVEKFLDTPVKHYSSGMYVRLAFAVAAHLEPEILVVDEVLAVGDAQFQKKCLGKMEDVAHREGRTVLFVSHQMATIQNLCKKSILLNRGQIVREGNTDLVIGYYLNNSLGLAECSIADRKDRQGNGDIRFTSILLQNEREESINAFYSGQDVCLKLIYENSQKIDLKNLNLAIGIDSPNGERIAFLSNETAGQSIFLIPKNIDFINIFIKKLPLTPGRYSFSIYCELNGVLADWIQNAGFFDVIPGDYYKTGKLPPTGQGSLLLNYSFNLN
jgi:lipopolysaccharide transport system ATP-binding protein